MSIRARLKRLEQKAGIGQMCLGCKRNLILHSDIIRRTPREELDVRPCDKCGFPYFTILAGYSERERALTFELMGEVSDARQSRARSRTLVERQRNYAAQLYWYILPRTREIREAGEREEKRLRDLTTAPAGARAQLKVLDEWKALEAEAEATRRLRRSEEEEAAREERRAKSAPTMAAIERAKAEHAPDGRLARRSDEELYYLHIMAGLEPLIYGETLSETLAKIEARERELREEEEAREREERERREQRERERLEREERYRLEREQREREREERLRRENEGHRPTPENEDSGAWLRAYKPPPEQPASRFRKAGGAVTHDLVVIPEPGGYDPNHPDAVQFQRSTPEKPLERRY